MADNMFAETFVSTGGNKKYTVLLSIVAHTAAIAAAIVVPLVATDAIVLPARFITIAFAEAPPPPSLPRPRGIARGPVPDAPATVPLVAPDQIVAETVIQSTSGPLDGAEYNAGIIRDIDSPAPPSDPPALDRREAPLPVGGDIKRPMKVKDVAPVYPAIAQAARVQGIVIIAATIGRDGKVQDARVLRSNPLLDNAALDAVRRWEYTPTLLNGTPVAIVMTFTVEFRLR